MIRTPTSSVAPWRSEIEVVCAKEERNVQAAGRGLERHVFIQVFLGYHAFPLEVILLFILPVVRFLKLLRYIDSFRLLVATWQAAELG